MAGTEPQGYGRTDVDLTSRLATPEDAAALVALMDAAIVENPRAYLDWAQIESSKAIMGLDRQLIADGTYFVVEFAGVVVGCGGWSRRATLYGGDHSAGRDASLLDPATQPAKVRAMYTHPAYVRRGWADSSCASARTRRAVRGSPPWS